MTIFSVSFEMKERFAKGRLLDRSSLCSEGFFNNGLIMDDFKVEGKVPVVMERFTIERIVRDIALEFSLVRLVRTGSDNSMNQIIERVDCRFRVR